MNWCLDHWFNIIVFGECWCPRGRQIKKELEVEQKLGIRVSPKKDLEVGQRPKTTTP